MSTVAERKPKTEPERTVAPPRLSSHDQVTIIRPAGGWKFVDFRELWEYRGLIFNFIWRDIKVRYKHTVLGIGWAVIQPLMMMIVFTAYFSAIKVGGSATSMPYALFVYSGVLPWFFFSAATVSSGNSIVHSEHLITKIYFPRMVSTVASAGVAVVDFIIGFLVFLGLILTYLYRGADNVNVGLTILLVPLVVLLFAYAALSMGILLAALNVTYRDFRLIIPFALQMWFFITPVIFLEPPSPPPEDAAVPTNFTVKADGQEKTAILWRESLNQEDTRARNRHQFLLYTNPLCSLVMTFRAAVLGGPVPWAALGLSVAIFTVIFFVGSLYFHRVEDRFADII